MHVVKTRHHPLDVSIDDSFGSVKGDRRNRGCGVGANPGQSEQCAVIIRKKAAMVCHNDTGAFEQVSCPGIVAQSRPSGHNIGIVSGGKFVDCGPK